MTNWLDVQNHGFARVGLAVPLVTLADPEANAKSHYKLLSAIHDEGACFALCPELGLTGYSCQDLFFQDTLLDAAKKALGFLLRRTTNWDMLISVGIPLAYGNGIYNCVVSIYRTKILAVVPKTFLPEYREFWEKRWFACADDASFSEVELLGQTVPFGNRILMQHAENRNLVIHEQVCEDGWLRFSPSGEAALMGATVLANASASNITIGKAEFRRAVVGEASSALDLAAQLYVSAGFGESSTDVSWDGHGFICERGVTTAETDRFDIECDSSYLVHDVDIGQLVADRRTQGSFRDSATRLRRRLKPEEIDFRTVLFGEQKSSIDTKVHLSFRRSISPHPFVPADSAELSDRCHEVFNIQATALARRAKQLPENTKIVMGGSGGLDSTHALLVATRAQDLLKRSRENITVLTMPGFGTTLRTLNNAIDLSNALGVTIRKVPITAQNAEDEKGIAEILLGLVGHDCEKEDLALENSQAWCRKILELTTGAKDGGFVLGTGDLSELALGWCTMFGDHASHYGVNAGVAKTLIRFMVEWTAINIFKGDGAVQETLSDILDTPISPELKRPDGDQIAQVTEEVIGPYELHDFTLYWGVRFGVQPSKIARMALHAFDGKYTIEEIVKWQNVFWDRFFKAQYKRNCLPDGPKVGLVCLSPRGDWRMPSDASPSVWLDDLETVRKANAL